MEGNGRGLICLEGLSKTTKTLSQDTRPPDRDLNRDLPNNEALVSCTLPRLSVLQLWSE
jgi:hypothetical protein